MTYIISHCRTLKNHHWKIPFYNNSYMRQYLPIIYIIRMSSRPNIIIADIFSLQLMKTSNHFWRLFLKIITKKANLWASSFIKHTYLCIQHITSSILKFRFIYNNDIISLTTNVTMKIFLKNFPRSLLRTYYLNPLPAQLLV